MAAPISTTSRVMRPLKTIHAKNKSISIMRPPILHGKNRAQIKVYFNMNKMLINQHNCSTFGSKYKGRKGANLHKKRAQKVLLFQRNLIYLSKDTCFPDSACSTMSIKRMALWERGMSFRWQIPIFLLGIGDCKCTSNRSPLSI